MSQHPPVSWAERPDCVLITVCLQDTTNVKVRTLEKSLEVSCTSDEKDYKAVLELKGEVVPEESSYNARPRQIEMKLIKKEQGPYWEGLVSKKNPHVKVDWSRWKDEDEVQGDDTGDFGLGAGMPGMEGLGDLGGLNLGGGGDPEKIQQMLDSMGSQEEESPAPITDDGDDDDDDDDMPALEKVAK